MNNAPPPATTHAVAQAAPRVAAGHIVALRLIDAADAIDLAAAETLWRAHAARQPAGHAQRRRLATTPSKAVSFGVPPLEIPLDPVRLSLGSATLEAAASARLYDFGAITLSLRVPATAAAGIDWPGFVALTNAIDAAVGPDTAAQSPWPAMLDSLSAILAASFQNPATTRLEEDYLLAVVERFDTPVAAADLLRQLDLAALLSGEQRPLSEAARADLLRHRFSYYEDDLVVLAWDRAFIHEPRGDTDVADVIEVANAQLLEMRYYDELLDAELPRMYGHVASARRGLNFLRSRRYAGLAHRLYRLVAEVTELTERVDNALQVTEDVYLARVYTAALEQFRVASVTAAVNRKLAIIRETYAALYEEAAGARAEWLEIAIVALILFEVVMALIGK